MGLFSVISGIIGGGSMKKASQKAMEAQTAAANRGIDIQQKQYETTRADYMPYTQAGVKAIGGYGDLLGTNGADAEAAAVAQLRNSPFFQQNLDDANENLLQTASATGGVRGGNTAGAVGELSPKLLQQYYQQAMTGYGNLAQLGLGATGSVSNADLSNANAATSLTGQIGQAQATNYLTKGGINAANWNNVGGFLDQAASAFLPIGFGGITAASTAKTQGASLDLINAHKSIF
ncbi:hypothetical protein U1701_17570 [Sphingomonas sp. PB2P19]|uniref:hypothetical protein n=1 Tax=Sphingomonas rhamnosi TaxID=3096156 RepID=UPI002FCB70B9